ncbi:DUF1127 domain-containing protein [Cochlodiniinecator piscidefendens]|uniref:DUF1127 domain-containing protein n=1 Tax=Cochlodiniinecator piscidefendens TaxID=2715756 RepID=UPI00140C1BDF|nr:DUF1127 domain-containing protein [Cochlodiniinecator piscidefendens]
MSETSQCAHAGHSCQTGSVSILAMLRNWRELSRQRNALLKLDSTQLNDVGIQTEEALKEANKPFWDAPTYWHHLK